MQIVAAVLLGSDTGLRGLLWGVHGDLAASQGFGALKLHGAGGLRDLAATLDQGLLRYGKIGTRGILLQRVTDGVVHRLKNRLFVGELDLQLGGMHVDVHAGGVQLDVHNAGGVFFGRYVGHEGLLQRGLRGTGAHEAIIDKEILAVAVGFDVIRAADEARDTDTVVFLVERDEAGGKLLAEHRPDGTFELSVTDGLHFGNAVRDEAHRDLGMRERDPLNVGGDRHGLGGIPLQEFAASGDVPEQIFHDDGGTVPSAVLADTDESSADDLQHRARGVLAALGYDAHIRHRGDGGQCFPSEAEGSDAVQILGGADLGGGVAADGHRQILGRHAASVIGHPHEGDAAVLYLHGNMLRPCVNGVFHHFLDSRCGAVHHLACGDEVGDLKGQNLNMSHG